MTTVPIKVACLGWGSLIWDPRTLPLASKWFKDGPVAPVEFSRRSKDGRITLVIDPSASPQTLLWAELSCRDLQSAKEALRQREDLTGSNWSERIGVWQFGDPAPRYMSDLPSWADMRGMNAVIWTALEPKFNGESRPPTINELLDYLRALPDEKRERARQYIENTPRQIATRYRREIEANLGWTCQD